MDPNTPDASAIPGANLRNFTPARSLSKSSTASANSELLREALRDKRALRAGQPPPKPKSYQIAISNEPANDVDISDDMSDGGIGRLSPPSPRPASTPRRPRPSHRASNTQDPRMAGSTSPVNRLMEPKEAQAYRTKLENANYDLGLRISLQAMKMEKLQRELDEANERLQSTEELEQANKELKDENQRLKKRVETLDDECNNHAADNEELTHINEELVRQLEERDADLREREEALQEAAQMITELEERLESFETYAATPRADHTHDSDYYSIDEDSPTKRPRAPLLKIPEGQPSAEQLSDYFSAGSSPAPPVRSVHVPRERVNRLIRTNSHGPGSVSELKKRLSAISLKGTASESSPPIAIPPRFSSRRWHNGSQGSVRDSTISTKSSEPRLIHTAPQSLRSHSSDNVRELYLDGQPVNTVRQLQTTRAEPVNVSGSPSSLMTFMEHGENGSPSLDRVLSTHEDGDSEASGDEYIHSVFRPSRPSAAFDIGRGSWRRDVGRNFMFNGN